MKKAAFLISIILLASCSSPRKITVSGPVVVEPQSLAKVDVSCLVENCSVHKVRLLEAKFRLHYETAGLADVMLGGEVIVPKCSKGMVTFPLRVKFSNPLVALSAMDFENLDWENLYITGEAKITSGLGRKKIRVADFPAREILTIFETAGGEPSK